MGNRLRAELGLTRSNGYKLPSNPPQPVAHAVSSVYPKELVQEAQNRLLALEQLQYQLTTQELQYAQRQHSTGLSVKKCFSFTESELAENIQGNQIPRTQNYLKSPVLNSGSDQQNENKHPEFHQSVQSGSSCPGDVSLQDVWQILDMSSSPSVSSTQGDTLQVDPQTARTWRSLSISTAAHQEMKSPFTVQGTKVEVQQKSKSNKQTQAYVTKITNSQQMPKIRNYNLKD
ncbi:coiled-coil domain-containing protein 57-like [Rhinatrema bivittatum]|uniref:coiled-coil domain-containing protein 57-like n=1 Tax=Rhinatrema bivittatum TaxID=194408 RepID=UPI001127A8D7|nr:coiled-coil domain-containing protein 57-like [Rhinatrema bivittatum]